MSVKLLLREDTEGLGVAGDIITVSEGYARNYLLPRRVAVEVTANNLKALEGEKRRRAARELERVQDLKVFAERIQTCDITLRERVRSGDNLYGAISPKEIVTALAEEEIHVEESMIHIDEPIKTLGVHRVRVQLHAEVKAELKVWVVELKEADGKGGS